ncbi:ANTAR domain-containing protein [Neolewinella antarctica]|uniref:CheY-like chemotaxis protein n=1 Tax=Neolewinella antarctica TaxID=442734 RepID=A0ABX0XDX7_9BACT|nr:hypothetical protein [Neolewinella antarctica]NJC27417.1 CheY-like chemotaxis protein [Neolewinella antarctica]
MNSLQQNTARPACVLLWEDDPIQALALTGYLEELAYRIIAVTSDGDALRRCREEKIDVAIFSSGPANLAARMTLAEHFTGARLSPVLFLSSTYAAVSSAALPKDISVLQKPYTFTSCRRCITQLVEDWLNLV